MTCTTSYLSEYLIRIKSVYVNKKLKCALKVLLTYSNNIFDMCLCAGSEKFMRMYQYYGPCWIFIYYCINDDT